MGKTVKFDHDKSYKVIAVNGQENTLSRALTNIQDSGEKEATIEIHVRGVEITSITVPAGSLIEILDILNLTLDP